MQKNNNNNSNNTKHKRRLENSDDSDFLQTPVFRNSSSKPQLEFFSSPPKKQITKNNNNNNNCNNNNKTFIKKINYDKDDDFLNDSPFVLETKTTIQIGDIKKTSGGTPEKILNKNKNINNNNNNKNATLKRTSSDDEFLYNDTGIISKNKTTTITDNLKNNISPIKNNNTKNKIESDDELEEIEKRGKLKFQLEKEVVNILPHLSGIVKGTIFSDLADKYKKGGRDRKRLKWNLNTGGFSELEFDLIIEVLQERFPKCDLHYIADVLWEETAVKLLMGRNKLKTKISAEHILKADVLSTKDRKELRRYKSDSSLLRAVEKYQKLLDSPDSSQDKKYKSPSSSQESGTSSQERKRSKSLSQNNSFTSISPSSSFSSSPSSIISSSPKNEAWMNSNFNKKSKKNNTAESDTKDNENNNTPSSSQETVP